MERKILATPGKEYEHPDTDHLDAVGCLVKGPPDQFCPNIPGQGEVHHGPMVTKL